MILYEYQLVHLERHDDPAVYLGYDDKVHNKVWVVRLNDENEPFIDWFMTSQITYYTGKSQASYIPYGRAIAFGKYKNNNMMTVAEKPSDADIKKYGDYLIELKKKYSKTKKENE